MDFLNISVSSKNNKAEIFPEFTIKKSRDLMIRGGAFYAIWNDSRGFWSTDPYEAVQLIDEELKNYADEYKQKHPEELVKVLYLKNAKSGSMDAWKKYTEKQLPDNFHALDERIIFANDTVKKSDYATRRLSYNMEEGPCPAYERMISTLYSEDERRKIEWAIGSVITGASRQSDKFLVFYGAPGTGKSTVLNIIESLFSGYTAIFDAKSIGSSASQFSLEAFRSNPLVAIQHDGDLSRIEDNTKLNSLISHEGVIVNEKHKTTYTSKFDSMLFMGTNKPVKITDTRSGMLRRLIDVYPTGDKLKRSEYDAIKSQIPFELGAIAYHCKQVYLNNARYYDDYVPLNMLDATNDMFNFVSDSYLVFKKENAVTLKSAWELYKAYCLEAAVKSMANMRTFKEELKEYFDEYYERYILADGTRARSYFKGFKSYKIDGNKEEEKEPVSTSYVLKLEKTTSLIDELYSDCPAQEANDDGFPPKKWDKSTTTLKDIDTHKIHYVQLPENHIVIDFDIPNEKGEKDRIKNLEEAAKWPQTYAEFSKSGAGVHLHYIYAGDVSKLSRVYDDHIEVKVFTGNASLRRKLTYCNDIPVATISMGLPLKGETVVNFETLKNEKALRTLIKRNLNKEIHSATKPSVDFIFKALEDAYNGGMKYDVSDLKKDVISFAINSTHQADACMKLVAKMHFKSDDIPDPMNAEDERFVFFDIEVFPNLLLVNWKYSGDSPIVRMINPSPVEIEELVKHKLIGFNNRRYDNHILYARMLGKSIPELYNISQRIVKGDKDAMFGGAYNLSYTDIYDFSSTKQSLKKFEIELGLHHQELGLPWDQPVPEELWSKVSEYCDNDVISTEATFNALQADWTARLMLAEIAGMTPNDTTNSLTARIIFGENKHPQDKFNYRDMSDCTDSVPGTLIEGEYITAAYPDEFTRFTRDNKPVFPGYVFDCGKSTYRGEEVGEGGYVYAEPGIYRDVALLDIASMHPSSAIDENLFGPYTKNYADLKQARIYIKHKEFDKAREMLDGKLAKYLQDEKQAKQLSKVLKIPINAVYGMTSASFENPFRDPRNVDNIVAKRGALFMINLKHEVQKRGFTVAHIKTDSIKIPNATPEIISFVMAYGKMYGYDFEHEATYEKMCLVNDAVYIAKYAPDYIPKGDLQRGWTATGTQFAVPYVFKTLFSKEPIEFGDMCETKSVTSALYLDMNEQLGPDEHDYRFIGKVGLFCPMVGGANGGLLVREAKDKQGNVKYDSATGAKGYRWLEAEQVKSLGLEGSIDKSYYTKLVDDAVTSISKYGNIEEFLD